MLGPLQSLKKLESLVQEASAALRATSTENRTLKEKLARLDAEHKRLKEDLRAASARLSRYERLRSRLARLSEKLERTC